MQLASEDTLKLNVLLANAQAIRINESDMSVHGLTGENEAIIRLNPTCGEEKYLRLVREMLATHALGSPRGYPVYLKRWTRLGDMQISRLEDLLLLGEEEAVIAAARAPNVTDELARRVWWALPRADVARYLLDKPAVARGRMGPRLAEFLLEFLPFEDRAIEAIESVRLVLQPGLISGPQRDELWRRGVRRTHYLVGFLHAVPEDLPLPETPHPDLVAAADRLQQADSMFAARLLWLLSSAGRGFLVTCERALHKPADQDVVVSLLEAVTSCLQEVRCSGRAPASAEELESRADECLRSAVTKDPALRQVPGAAMNLQPMLRAMMVLALGGEPLVRPIFARTDAIGSVMRRKIAPVTDLLRSAIATLLNDRIVQSTR